jgi:hypothetical protein
MINKIPLYYTYIVASKIQVTAYEGVYIQLKLDVQVFKLRKTVGKRVRESVLQFDVFQQYVDEPACAVYKNFCH